MRHRASEDRDLAIRRDHRRRMPDDAIEILIAHRVEDTLTAALLDDPECRIRGVFNRRLAAAEVRDIGERLAGE